MPGSQDREDLDGYNLVGEIGHSRQSVVHKAICTRGRLCSRLVAVKVTRLEALAKDDVEVSLTKSSKLQQELYHPNILAVYSAFVQLDTHIQVMEYCSLGCLAEYKEIKGYSSPPDSFIFRLLRGIANALVYLHGRRIIHRTIQPANIFLGENQTPKISHFESAVRLPSICPPFSPPTAYTAPEMIRGQPGSFPADVWSLGCVVFFTLTTQTPSTQATTPMALRALNCTPQLREILTGMLDYFPSRRLSAEALASHQVFKSPLNGSLDCEVPYPPAPPGQSPELRRNSFGDLGCKRAKQLFPGAEGVIAGERKWIQPTRRVVSDPLAMGKTDRCTTIPAGSEIAAQVLRDTSDPVPSENHLGPTKPKRVANSTVTPLPGRSEEDARRPEYIDTSCLRPQSQKIKEGRVSILRNGHVVVEFHDCFHVGEIKGKVMVIDSRQNQIYIHQDSNLSDALRRPIPLAQYTRESLPPVLRRQYQAASAVVSQMRKRAPKIVMHADDGKYTLMMNGPPADVEVSFLPVTYRNSGCQPGNEETTLRIRYSEEQGLIELRRYVGGPNGQDRMRKCVMSFLNPKEIPQAELAGLDDLEKDGLAHLLRFSEICRTIEELGLTMRNFDRRVRAETREPET